MASITRMDRVWMNRLLIWLGVIFVAAGICWPWLRRIRLFHLPGDIVVNRPGFQVYLPLTTMVILSIALSVVAWILRR